MSDDRTTDPTTAVLLAQSADRDQLRAENQRLSLALVAVHTEIEGLKTECDRQTQLGDAMFVAGYDQAVREIRDHFARPKDVEVVAEIEKIWMGKPMVYPSTVRKLS